MWDDLRDYKILEGDCIEMMRSLPSDSIDAIVTDPPYGLGFMDKDWDASVPGVDWARECLRVLKPGGHLVAFGGTRTVHRLTCAIEDGGFEIRDLFNWIYFSGFPKNLDISKQFDREAGLLGSEGGNWRAEGDRMVLSAPTDPRVYVPPEPQSELAKRYRGYGTALKPAIEPATLARKPLEKGLSVARNVAKWGTGAINIDACRFGYGDPCWVGPQSTNLNGGSYNTKGTSKKSKDRATSYYTEVAEKEFINPKGRFPANLYQCAKPSRGEREAGLDHLKMRPARSNMCLGDGQGERFDGRESPEVANFHPTVKPIKLMRWLCKLIGGKKGSVILDTFCGSGTTGCAAILEGFDFVGIEITPDYLPIIRGRLEWSKEEYMRENAQLSLFEDAI